jgi:protein SCO1/2
MLAILVTAAVLALTLGIAAILVATRPGVSGRTTSDGTASIGGPFTLTDQDGRPATQHVLDGHWSAVFFGYTNCPDTCPATLQALNAASAQMSPQARKAFQVVFVSVDPARDSVRQMKLYTAAQGFPAGALVGLTGTPDQVKQIADAYHVYYKAVGTGGDYGVQHSAAVYLMDPRGRFVRPLSETTPPKELAQQIAAAAQS